MGMSSVPSPTAVMVIRVWMESNQATGFRARIVQTLNVADAPEASMVAGSREEVLAAVGAWLDELMSGPGERAPVPI
jgi:hypothetical protein